MTQMMIRPLTLEVQEPLIHLPEQLAMPSQQELERHNRVLAAAAYAFKDLVSIDIYQTVSNGRPGLYHDWEHAGTLPGIVVRVDKVHAAEAYEGFVPVLADKPYPTAGNYVNSGPRLLDPLFPQIERRPQGTDWLMYVLEHDGPVINL